MTTNFRHETMRMTLAQISVRARYIAESANNAIAALDAQPDMLYSNAVTAAFDVARDEARVISRLMKIERGGVDE